MRRERAPRVQEETAWPVVPQLRAAISEIEHSKHLTARRDEVTVRTCRMRERRHARMVEFFLNACQIRSAELYPRAVQANFVRNRLRRLLWREIGKLNAERAAVRERHEQNRLRQAEVEFAHVGPKHISKKRGKRWSIRGAHEEMNARPNSRDHFGAFCASACAAGANCARSKKSSMLAMRSSRNVSNSIHGIAPASVLLTKS